MILQFCSKCGESTQHISERFSDVVVIDVNGGTYLDVVVTYCEECGTIDDDSTYVC